jgi:hypothetical protein
MEDVYKNKPKNLISNFLKSLENQHSELHQSIVEFKAMIRLDDILDDRYSLVFLLDLYFAFENSEINVDALMHEVKFLEGQLSDSKTKPASKFLRPPLQGLWHKHFYDSSISGMAQNVKNALNSYSIPYFEKKIEEARESGEEKYMTVEDIPHLVNDIVTGNLKRRSEEQKITGEWLVYAAHEGVNYYLCIAKHREGDANIRKRLDSTCFYEFPFLEGILPSSQ